MRILVTGGSGFLGKNLEQKMKDIGWEFINFDISCGHDVLNIDHIEERINTTNPDMIVHACAIADLYESEKFIEKNYRVNVSGTFNIGFMAYVYDIPIINISTCCAYGNQQPCDEFTEPIPTETYAWSKLAAEKSLACCGDIRGLTLRLGTFYGPGMREALFNYKAIEAIMNDEVMQVFGTGEQSRQYIYVDDVSDAIIKACEHVSKQTNRRKPHEYIFNICGDESISVNTTIKTVEEIADKKVSVFYVTDRKGEIKEQRISNNKAKTFLGWKPNIDYQVGMMRSIEWYKKNACIKN
jgi:nucleoside-diphosphate-sugar epimerase